MSEPPRYPPADEPSDPGRHRPSPGGQRPYGPPDAEPQYVPQYGQQQYGPGYGPQYDDFAAGRPTFEQPPQYGQQPYPYPQTPGYGASPPTRARWTERLGPRVLRRSEPRLGVALAAVGIALVVFGVLVLGSAGGDGDSTISGGGHKAIGIVLSLALVAAGYALVWIRRAGPLATAGVAAGALGVPVALGFVCDAAGTGSTATTNILTLGSLVAWIASYLVVPGARGHVFFLGASTVTFWYFVLDKIESNFLVALFLAPFASLRASLGDDDDSGGLLSGRLPDFTTLATVSILIGVGYYLTAYLLDRTGRSGAATAFVVGGLPAMVFGLAVAAVKAPQSWEGVLIILAGAALGFGASRTLRRFTTWFWSAGVGVGIVVILADVVDNDDSEAGVSLIVLGVLLVLAAQLVATALREPDETVPTPPGPDRGPAA